MIYEGKEKKVKIGEFSLLLRGIAIFYNVFLILQNSLKGGKVSVI